MVKSSSWCEEQVGLKKGPWTPEEDQKLMSYIQLHGHGSWSSLPAKAGLRRCGKSCRLRWINYLRPDIKLGNFSLHEDQTIIQLHALLGNKWSVIAHHLPKRTDNEIKNHWNTHLKKRLITMGINPTTHKPLNDAANLSHMAQWETARLEAEARQVKEYLKLHLQNQLGSSSSSHPSLTRLVLNKITPPCLDFLRARPNSWSSRSANHNTPIMYSMYTMMLATNDLESPASTLNFPATVPTTTNSKGTNSINTFGRINRSSLPSSSSTTISTVGKDNGIMKGASDSPPCGSKERSGGDEDNIMAAMGALFPSVGQYYEGNEMSPQQNLGMSSVGDDWEDILDLVNGWPRSSPAFPMV